MVDFARPNANYKKEIKKKNDNFAVNGDHRLKLKESEKRDKNRDLVREKIVELEGDDDTNCNWCTWNNPQSLGKRIGKLGDEKTSGGHPDYSIIKFGPKYRGKS